MMATCVALPEKYANPFGLDHPAVMALLRTKRSRTSYAPATKRNRVWASRDLHCLWMYGLLQHLPRKVLTCMPLQLPERPTFDEVKADLGGTLQGCGCGKGMTCYVDTLAYIANAKGYPVHPPLIGPPPERRRSSSPAERDELARTAYKKTNRWGI